MTDPVFFVPSRRYTVAEAATLTGAKLVNPAHSDIEISKKREALENVLIPYRLDENVQLLKEAGFRSVEIFFRWYNFCGIVAIK